MIKNIYIVNNGDVIDSLYEAQSFMAFKNQNITNDTSKSSNQQLVANFLGYTYDLAENRERPANTYNSVVSFDKFTTPNVWRGSNVFTEATTARYTVADDLAIGTATGYVDLTRCLNFLKSITFLDTSVFTQLRIVIEYNPIITTSIQYNINAVQSGVGAGTAVGGITRPVLIYDEITDDTQINKIRKRYNQVVDYNAIELIKTPFQLNGGLANFDRKLTGFNGKFLNRIVIFKQEYTDYRRCYSFPYQGESFNLVINGRKLYPYDVDTKNKRISYLTESWGSCSYIGFENDATQQNAIKTERRINSNDYCGSIVQQQIEEFILNMSVNDPRSGVVNLLIYGEVRKQMVIKNGKYVIRYSGI